MTGRSGLAGILLVLVSMLAMFSLTGFQVTSEEAATRLLGRLGATLVELDLWLPAHQEELALIARDRPDGPVQIRDLPFSVTIPAEQLRTDDDVDALRERLAAAFGSSLYHQGTGAFVEATGEEASLGVTEPVRWMVNLLDSRAHGFWQAALALTLLLGLALTALVLTAERMPLWHISAGAGAAAALSAGGWLLMELTAASIDNPLDRETVLILRDGTWIGVRNGLAVAIGLAALTLIIQRAGVTARLQPAGRLEADPADDPRL